MYRERTAGVPLNLWNVNRFYEMGEKEAFGVLSDTVLWEQFKNGFSTYCRICHKLQDEGNNIFIKTILYFRTIGSLFFF